ncbi:D-alanyl-D-alanine carboxypeptidase-like protein [Chthoniobacter flavus]|nr:serine hydrolase [Chthoniobacter flavus]TCO88410.1 D-alanyl-D-alanine carboxypeptidase-like protein [Chthoniobacter flavus]
MVPSKFALVALLFTLLAVAVPGRAEEAAAYAVTDSTTGFVLDQYRGDKKLPIGSLTKVATAMVVLDWSAASNSNLDQVATVPGDAAQIASSQGTNLQPGDRVTLRDLLYAALMQSDNVAALTLADHVGQAIGGGGRPVENFVAQMNALARTKGMRNTKFLNPHGLDNLERSVPYSTADDLAKLTAYAMANSAFRFYVSQRERKITIFSFSTGGQSAYLLRNTNELLGINSIDGVKTGTTARAGQCVIISAARTPESRQEGETHVITPRRLNVVVLGATNRFANAQALLARGWQLYDAWAAAGRPAKWKAPR